MPCHDPCDNGAYEIAEMQKRLDRATRAACEMAAVMEQNGGLTTKLSVPTQRWIAAHQEADKRRLAVEEAQILRDQERQEALKKLTPTERKLLGLR